MSDANEVVLSGRVMWAKAFHFEEGVRWRGMVGSKFRYQQDGNTGPWKERSSRLMVVSRSYRIGERAKADIRVGMRLMVRGRLKTEEWTSKDGVHHEGAVVEMTEFWVLGLPGQGRSGRWHDIEKLRAELERLEAEQGEAVTPGDGWGN